MKFCLLFFHIFITFTSNNLSAQELGKSSNIELMSENTTTPVLLIPKPNVEKNLNENDLNIIDSSIQVQSLEAVSPGSIGLIDESSGGLPSNFWSDTPKELVTILFPKLPTLIKNKTLRDLMNILLLSVATPPQSNPTLDILVDMEEIVPISRGFKPIESLSNNPPKKQSENDFEYLHSRLLQLSKMGQWDIIKKYEELIPESYFTENISILMNDMALVYSDYETVCDNAASKLEISKNSYWQKAFAFCQLLDGNISGAFLNIDLLREVGIEDKAFFWVAELMSGNRPITPSGLRFLSPLHLSMLKSAKRPFPEQFISNGDPTLLKILASSDPLYNEPTVEDPFNTNIRDAVELRIEAAERSLELGIIDAEYLRVLYRNAEEDIENIIAQSSEQNFDTDIMQDDANDETPEPILSEEIDKLTSIDKLDNMSFSSPLERAALFRLAEEQEIPTAKAEVISRVINISRQNIGEGIPDLGTVGQIFSSQLMSMEPTSELIWFAGNAVRALIAAGLYDRAMEWLNLSRLYSRTSIEASEVSVALWPIERQLQPGTSNFITPIRLKRWSDTRPKNSLNDDKLFLLSSLTALGDSISQSEWIDLMDRRVNVSTSIPATQIWEGLKLASEEKKVGETILFSILSLSNIDLVNVSPIVLSRIIKSLIEVGLERQARNISVEAMILRGL